jgi:hypothetical protein
MTPEERLPFYYQLVREWGTDSMTKEELETMVDNVLAGL